MIQETFAEKHYLIINIVLTALIITGAFIIYGMLQHPPHIITADCRTLPLDYPVICFEE